MDLSQPDSCIRPPDRPGFFQKLHDELGRCRNADELLAVIMVDLSNFRNINSMYGYTAGNQVLNEVNVRLQTLARVSDSVMRIGNDEFALVLPAIRNRNIPVLAANKIGQVLQAPFDFPGGSIKLKANLGIAIFPDHADEADSLMQQAEKALMEARELQERYVIARCEEETSAQPAQFMESELEAALAQGDFELYYQPKVNLHSGQMAGAEALIRWNHPEKGLIRPDLFIPLVEKLDFRRPLTLWVINTALREAGAIRNRWGGKFSVSVNIPANMLHQPYLIELVERALVTWDTRPEQLVLEITESAIMSDPELALQTLQRFYDLGVGLSLDDFGTGYSSFAYLKRMPIHELKIDKEFIFNMLNDKVNERIVESIIHLAHNLGLEVIAEGIEDADLVGLLKQNGCDLIQGYHVARPMPLGKFLDWVEQSDWGLGGDSGSKAEYKSGSG